MATSSEIRRGQTALAQGVDSDILLGPTITALNLAAELAKYSVQPGTVAWNFKQYMGAATVGALHAFYDVGGKWYNVADGTEVS